MIFGMTEAVDEIVTTVTNSLGPLANLTTASTADWLGYLADIGIQLASTIILFIVIRFLLWKPITKILESRRDAIDKELNDAKEAKKQAVKLEEELLLEKKKAQAEIRDLISNAEKEANLRRDEIINQAKEEAKMSLLLKKLICSRILKKKLSILLLQPLKRLSLRKLIRISI